MKSSLLLIILGFMPTLSNAQRVDNYTTQSGKKLQIHLIGHGTLMFQFNDKCIHVDPWSNQANYDTLPKADYIVLTHHHRDHLDSVALSKIFTGNTELYWTSTCAAQSRFRANGTIVANGDTLVTRDFRLIAVPAYNIVNKRPNGEPFHPKGEGNGYIFEFENLRVYVAGDTENIPEMGNLGRVDIAFLPANLPFTMSPEMFRNAVQMVRPKTLYPYHMGNTEKSALLRALSDIDEVDVRWVKN